MLLKINLIKHTQSGRELTYDQDSTLVLSLLPTTIRSSNTCIKTSHRSHNNEMCDNNFHQDSPSGVTKDFDHNIDASANALLENATNREAPKSNSYLPS